MIIRGKKRLRDKRKILRSSDIILIINMRKWRKNG
jgi:hypothetical protein